MTTALIRIRQCASSHDPSFICPENALHVYCLALNHGLLKETLEAAEVTLKSPMTIQDPEDKLDTIPGVTLHKFWKYRQRVLGNLDEILVQEFCDSEVYRILCDAALDCVELSDYGDNNPGIPLWLDEYLNSVAGDPSCFNVTTFHLAQFSHVSPAVSH
ncbi:hypothetical protein EDB92DRAFT_1612020 [Lactarius akahatsu]|uniref:Uncharacterized protein n=1 Tax=Lactarius akahatsu TaxID=416441 RepID=A0AAD4Q9R2_9AGAM|nr:hypothetical protein EDB92DRAFT_1612020 [Lactarius akahatsu]